ncbi:MAG: alpha/beta hydrolase [Crocinitomicaceae bacterium]
MTTLQIIGVSVLGFIGLILFLNLLGRKHFNPKGKFKKASPPKQLKIGKNRVEFLSEGDKISGFLFIPQDAMKGEKKPAIILMPPHSGVKEQTAGIYAQKLSEQGYITLTFDPRGFGESTGHKGLVSPWLMVEDQKNAVDFITSLDMVDNSNLFNFGICAGAGVATDATISDSRIKALALVSPYVTYSKDGTNNSNFVKQMLITVGGFVRLIYRLTGKDLTTVPVPVDEKKASGGAIPVSPMTLGMMTYYLPGKPGDTPTWENIVSMNAISAGLDWSVFDRADNLKVPTFMVYGTKAESIEGSVQLYDQIKSPKEKLVLDGASHFETYYKPKYVEPDIQGITEFINNQISQN